MKLLGIQIANGYSSEARVFASLLGNRAGAYDALVLHQEGPQDNESPKSFAADAKASIERLDFGWRPSPPGGHSPLAKVSQYLQLRRTVKKAIQQARVYDPDIVYSNQQHWDCYVATEVAKALGKPQVIHLHYIIGPWLRQQPLQRLLTTDHVIVVSDFIRGEALKHGVAPERVTTVRNTMAISPEQPARVAQEVRAELGIPADAPLIGIIARLSPGKGQDDTIEAFSLIAGQYPNARLMIVGDGETRQALEEQAGRLGVKDRVLFTGRRSDVPRLLAAIDLFSHPSRLDPCPLALLEACAAGLPVVAYAEGGACEVVLSDETGVLVPPGDVKGLAGALAALIKDRSRAKQLGIAARAHIAAHFQPSIAGQELARVLAQVANG